ncbi:DUF5668 domain-containing protein [Niabella terrae]
MTENNPYKTEMYNQPEPDQNFRPRSSQSHVWIGGFLLVVGIVYLLRKMGVDLPDFIFSWQMLLIALGIFVGIRKSFEGVGWMILILVGAIPMINEYFVFGQLRRFVVPIILIGSGLFFIFRPKGSRHIIQFDEGGASGQDYIDTTSIFGGTKKKVYSKNFKGGDMTNIFGGSSIDLTQADIQGTAVLDVTALFGGSTLIVPSHWNVISEAVAILGEVKDKRVLRNNPENDKVLMIKGTVVFGGIDIKSF